MRSNFSAYMFGPYNCAMLPGKQNSYAINPLLYHKNLKVQKSKLDENQIFE